MTTYTCETCGKDKLQKVCIECNALNTFADVTAFQSFLRNVYGKEDKYIKSQGYCPSIDNVAIGDILFTMEEYDHDGRYIAFYNRRTDTRMEIETANRYKSWEDAEVSIYENYGAYRNDISYID